MPPVAAGALGTVSSLVAPSVGVGGEGGSGVLAMVMAVLVERAGGCDGGRRSMDGGAGTASSWERSSTSRRHSRNGGVGTLSNLGMKVYNYPMH